jgi:hypothetical protein
MQAAGSPQFLVDQRPAFDNQLRKRKKRKKKKAKK